MNYPKIQFLLNKELDKWTAKEFEVETESTVSEFYSSHIDELQKFTTEANTHWRTISPQFFKITSTLFNNHPWPEGKYIGYISMFDCNPRFLDDKTFQVYYKHHAGSNYVTAHELLHFMFYDYAIKKHPNLFEGKDTESGIFWDVAEVFNSVLLHSNIFLPLLNVHKNISYPKHTAWVTQFKNIWDINPQVDGVILEIYNYILHNPIHS